MYRTLHTGDQFLVKKETCRGFCLVICKNCPAPHLCLFPRNSRIPKPAFCIEDCQQYDSPRNARDGPIIYGNLCDLYNTENLNPENIIQLIEEIGIYVKRSAGRH